MKRFLQFSILAIMWLSFTNLSFAQKVELKTKVFKAEAFTKTIPLKDMKIIPPTDNSGWKNGIVPNEGLPEHLKKQWEKKQRYTGEDPVLQKEYAPPADNSKAVVQNFDGMNNTFGSLPPDTDGDVGLNHYIQMVNSGFQIFDKAGNALTSVASLSTIWNSLPGPWVGTNNGDPIVLYDEMADRWLLSQFSLPNYPNGPFYELIAVSSSPDPLGTYNLYAFSFTDMPDYPKFGVWPDGYYMSINKYSSGSINWAGAGFAVFERDKMLIGDPSASMQYGSFTASQDPWSFLPSDVDGPVPPSGTPNYFTYVDFWSATDRLRTYYFHVDWATPGNSAFTGPYDVPVPSINNTFGKNDIPQPVITQQLDPMETRLMYRLQYRNFGTYQTLVTNQTVNVSTSGSDRAGIRWYELRNSGSGWSLFQSGTYAPSDIHSRWMASVAMNRNGDIALGYSISDSNLLYPSIRYTGRLSTDSPGTMSIPETTIVSGSGYQSHSSGRWGDYSAMSVDPSDDYTFWYTQEYIKTNGAAKWRTRIASMTFGTAPVPDVWIGSSSNNWNDKNNWQDGSVPYRSDDVIISGAPPPQFWPTVFGDLNIGTQSGSITMNNGADLTVQGNFEISKGRSLICNSNETIRVGKDWINNGTYTPAQGMVILNGNTTSSITGPSGTVNLFYDGFETPSGWMLSGEFEIATPSGKGGSQGNPDPSSAFMGTGVLGVDLTGLGTYPGDYEPNLGSKAVYAISPPINCLGFTNILLNFQRWLNVEQDQYDNAYIDISNDNGATWNNIWQNNNVTISESSWSLQAINISAYADDQPNIQIRFSIGTTDGSWQFSGWNIDEFNITGTGFPYAVFNDLVIEKANAIVYTNSDVTVQNDFTIRPGASFTDSLGSVLTVNGNTTFEADASGMASFIDFGSTIFTNNPNVQMYLLDGRWHFIGMPVSSAMAGVFHLPAGHSDIYLRTHDEATNTWNSWIVPVTTPLALGRGYETWVGQPWVGGFTQPETITFTGSLNTGDYTTGSGGFYGLQYTNGHGLNMISNPYPSALLGNINIWSKNNVANSLWTWSQSYGNYVYWNGANGSNTSGWGTMNGGVIPAMQGFFVEASGSSPWLTIPQNDRIHSNQPFYKDSYIPENTLKLEVTGNDYKDVIFVSFNEQATEGFDNVYDVQKLFGLEEAPQLYSVIPGKQLSINSIPELLESRTVQLGFECGVEGLFTFTANNLESFIDYTPVYLEDTKEGTIQKLNDNPIYIFNHSLLDDNNRFRLHFGEVNGIGDLNSGGINVYSNKNTVYVQKPADFNGYVSIYDILGREIITQKATGEGIISIPVTNGTGYYVVKVQSDNNLVTRKVFIK